MNAHAASKTYDCKQPNCTNEARSPVGRYSYCDEHQGQGKKATPVPPVTLHLIGEDCTASDGQAWTVALLDWKLFDRWRQAWEGSRPTATQR